ncbi:hypothetical protein Tco_0243420, partial [Tanacetum coccineum]
CYAAICTLVWASEVVSSGFPIVKVRRDSKRGPKFTWKREDHMKAKYSRLFVDYSGESSSSISGYESVWIRYQESGIGDIVPLHDYILWFGSGDTFRPNDGTVNVNDTVKQILEPLSKMTEGNKKQYIADVKVMNYLLQAIPNDIYNSVDACKNAKSKKGESLESVYERLTMFVNITDRNNVRLIPVSINTKFLNCLQPEWSKYVTMDGRVDIQTKNAGYGGNGKKNVGRQSRNQSFNAGNGNDDSNQIVQRAQ